MGEISIGVISTHSDLTFICRQLGEVPGYKILLFEGVLDSSLPGLKYFAEKDVEVIVTTRDNTLFVKDHTKIPVIAVPENRFDTFRPLARAVKNYGREVVVFFYRHLPKGFPGITEALGFEPKVMVYEDGSHLEQLLEDLQGSDQVIVGGGYVCQVASSLGFITEPINLSKESFLAALEAAKELAAARRLERKEYFRLNAILDWAHEGIVATDERGVITLFNKAAEKIFSLQAEKVIGLDSREVLSAAKLHEVIKSGETSKGEIVQIGSVTVAANRVPIISDSRITGTVATFQPVQTIQDIEEKIRRGLSGDRQGIRYSFLDIIGQSKAIRSAIELAVRFAVTDEAILILGESGTGKELFAQSIHGASKRKKKPFMAVNCAAIPGNLLESELFGYSEGAFTGARKGGKPGLFELAHGGSIFLDEIGDLPVDIQAKLLRVIQEKEVRRVGGEQLVRVDVRLIAATHQNLRDLVRQGKFREDLYYRLDVLRLEIPPLRERKEDLQLLSMELLGKSSGLSSKQKRVIAGTVMMHSDYDWPGNVRELENIMRRLAVYIQGLSEPEARAVARRAFVQFCGGKMKSVPETDNFITLNLPVDNKLKEIMSKVEKEVISRMVMLCGGDRQQAARKLGIGRTSLWRKMMEHEPEAVLSEITGRSAE